MGFAPDECSAVKDNLEAAGCDKRFIDDFLIARECEQRCEQLRMLRRQRASLLEQIHQGQKRLDCLDYLIYTIEKSKDG